MPRDTANQNQFPYTKFLSNFDKLWTHLFSIPVTHQEQKRKFTGPRRSFWFCHRRLCISLTTHSDTQRKSENMSTFTRTDCSNTAFPVFVLTVCAIFSSHVDANLLDPSQIMRELQTFANDALGVDKLQVRYTTFLPSSVTCQISCNVLKTRLQVPLKIYQTCLLHR